MPRIGIEVGRRCLAASSDRRGEVAVARVVSPSPAEDRAQSSTIRRCCGPYLGDTVSSTAPLERLDPETGKLVDLGLELGTSHDASRPPYGLVMAERGQSVFACSYVYYGTSGDAPVPPTVCGFTMTD